MAISCIPPVSFGEAAVAILVGILSTFAVAAYWLFQRDRTIDLVTASVPETKRQIARDTGEGRDHDPVALRLVSDRGIAHARR